jgi:hypothetical protein
MEVEEVAMAEMDLWEEQELLGVDPEVVMGHVNGETQKVSVYIDKSCSRILARLIAMMIRLGIVMPLYGNITNVSNCWVVRLLVKYKQQLS